MGALELGTTGIEAVKHVATAVAARDRRAVAGGAQERSGRAFDQGRLGEGRAEVDADHRCG
jgi:hypothetical protein